jgi:hypothetical protein
MMFAPSRAIAKASIRVLVAHLVKTLGSRTGVAVAVVTAVLALAGINLLVYGFSASNLGGIFTKNSPSGAAVSAARGVLVEAPGLTAAALGLVLLMFFPAESHISVSARVAGASRATVALGEFVPVLATVIFVAGGTALGSTLFVAQSASEPAIAFWGLQALVLVDVLAVLLVNQAAMILVRALRAPESVARIAGLLAGVGLIALFLANMLDSLLRAQTSWLSALTNVAWGGALPITVPTAGTTFAIAVVLLLLLLASLAIVPRARSTGGGSRLVSVALIGQPHRFVNFAVREAILALRHPVSQLSLVTAILLACLFVVGCRAGMVSLDLCAAGLAALFSTGVESAFGRMLPWAWVATQLRMSSRRLVFMQTFGSSLAGAILLVVGLAIASPIAATTTPVVPRALVLLALFCTIAYLSGVVAPYDRTAPLGMMLTSVVAVVLDAGIYWLLGTMLPAGGPASVLCELLIAGALIAISIALVRPRLRRAV